MVMIRRSLWQAKGEVEGVVCHVLLNSISLLLYSVDPPTDTSGWCLCSLESL